MSRINPEDGLIDHVTDMPVSIANKYQLQQIDRLIRDLEIERGLNAKLHAECANLTTQLAQANRLLLFVERGDCNVGYFGNDDWVIEAREKQAAMRKELDEYVKSIAAQPPSDAAQGQYAGMSDAQFAQLNAQDAAGREAADDEFAQSTHPQ